MPAVLLVATSSTPVKAVEEIDGTQRPHIDYLDLQSRLSADVIDFSVYAHQPYKALERPDRLSRLAWGQALYALRHWDNYEVVYSLGEDVGVPLAFLLRLRGMQPRHIMVAHNILSARKVPIVRAMGVMDRFDRIIVFSSEAVGGIVNTYGVRPERISFTMDAIDETFWQPDPQAQVEPDYVLSVGRARRDYGTLLAAIEGLPLRLRVQAGSQWYVGYESQAGNGRLPDNVEIGDYLSYRDLRALYDRAAFVVIPLEAGAHHSAGTVSIKEAMAMGKAVIVASDGGVDDYVRQGETGQLVPAGDPLALHQAIAQMLGDPDRTAEMGRRGRAFLEREMRYDAKIDWLASLAT
jgi:glycosyltransferase involved in cell wall biosynthesis